MNNENLTGKTVRLRQDCFREGLSAEDHLFQCEDGFGCDPSCTGTKIIGTWLSDGNSGRIHRGQVEAIVPNTKGKEHEYKLRGGFCDAGGSTAYDAAQKEGCQGERKRAMTNQYGGQGYRPPTLWKLVGFPSSGPMPP